MDRTGFRLGLVGWPVGRSLSPLIHGTFLRREGLAGSYRAIPVHRDRTRLALRRLWIHGMDGLNVTAPCKIPAVRACAGLHATARRAGAVNTLRRVSGGWEGHNTDLAGFRAMAAEAGAPPPFLVAGCGGAARGVAACCIDDGRDVLLFCRRPEVYDGPGRALPLRRLEGYMQGAGGTLVNATPLGWSPDDPMPVGPEALEGMVLLDLNYSRCWQWRMRAAERAVRTLTGEVMLVHQAAESFRLWTGAEPDVERATRAVRAALQPEDKERSLGT
jgi:shikimate dehydrogenase